MQQQVMLGLFDSTAKGSLYTSAVFLVASLDKVMWDKERKDLSVSRMQDVAAMYNFNSLEGGLIKGSEIYIQQSQLAE